MNKQLIANRPMTYATRRLKADDEFTASRRDAGLLVRLGRAREMREDRTAPATKPKPAAKPKAPRKRATKAGAKAP